MLIPGGTEVGATYIERVAHETALLCLDKETLLLDLKMQNLTFDTETGQMPGESLR